MAWGKHRSSKAKSQLEKRKKKSSLTSQEVIESCRVAVLPFFLRCLCQQEKRIYFSTQWTNDNSKAKEKNATGMYSPSTAAATSKYSEHQNMIPSPLLAEFSSTLSPVKVIGFIFAREQIKDTELTNR